MSHNDKLTGKVALITGASGGLGAQFAKTLSKNGATVILAARRLEKLNTLSSEIEKSGAKSYVVELDVNNYESIKSAIALAESKAGSIDILINNSGVSKTQKLIDVSPDDFELIFDTNTKGAFFVAQEVAKRMMARNRNATSNESIIDGRIVNIASAAGLRVLSQIGIYCMSKAAVIHMTRSMALEWGKFGINTNALCPGYIDTDINHSYWETEAGKNLINSLPRKRLGLPKDLDSALMLFVANESQFINGAVLSVDDGFCA